MSTAPRAELSSTVLGTPDPPRLAGFYRALLGLGTAEESPEWVVLRPAGGVGLSQREEDHEAPVWPQTGGHQQMQAHLDVQVDDLEAALAHARSLGARLAEHQPQEHVRVLLDPDGHPFCLFLPGS